MVTFSTHEATEGTSSLFQPLCVNQVPTFYGAVFVSSLSQGAIRSAERIQVQRTHTGVSGDVVKDVYPPTHFWRGDSAGSVIINTNDGANAVGPMRGGPEYEDNGKRNTDPQRDVNSSLRRWSTVISNEYFGLDDENEMYF